MRVKVLLTGCAIAVALAFASQASAQVPSGNHFLCRKVKDLQIPAKFNKDNFTGIATVDQVGADTCDAKKPFLLCSPLSVKGGPVGIPSPTLHYCCYKVKCGQKPFVGFDVTDQFGPLRLQTKKPFLMCNPCSKTPA